MIFLITDVDTVIQYFYKHTYGETKGINKSSTSKIKDTYWSVITLCEI